MHVLLHPVGSHGDVHPLVGIGRGLKARGHRVTLVTAAPFRGVAEACGFEFAAVGTEADYEAVAHNPDLWHPRRGLRTIFAPDRYGRLLREAYRHLSERYVSGDTVAMAGDLGFAARLVQEKLGLPVVSSHIAPIAFQSVVDPPTVWFGKGPRVPGWLGRLAYRLGGRFYVDPAFRPTVNAFRRELGLPPLRRLWGVWNDSPQRQIGLFPRWFADAPDWPETLRLVGFPRYDEADAGLPPAVEKFLADGPPPVVVSFGSAMRTGRPHFAAAVAAILKLGRRGLLLAKGGDQVPPLPQRFLHADYAPFSRVFPRAAAVVHHGGIGTTAQGLAAGVPHLVMPLAFDQFDNAARLVRLGVARVVPARRFTAEAAATALGELLGSADVAAACAAAKAKSAADAPVAEACRWVEELRGTDGVSDRSPKR